MSEIKKGDLVRIASYCCERTLRDGYGKIGRVRDITEYRGGSWTCYACGSTGQDQRVIAFNRPLPAAPLSWLKKIDPPSTGEYDRVPVRMKEPA